MISACVEDSRAEPFFLVENEVHDIQKYYMLYSWLVQKNYDDRWVTSGRMLWGVHQRRTQKDMGSGQ